MRALRKPSKTSTIAERNYVGMFKRPNQKDVHAQAANAGDAMLTAAITAPSISLEAVAMLFPSV